MTTDNNEYPDFYDQIITAYNHIFNEIDTLVEGSMIFTEPGDLRKIKLDEFLNNLKNNMETIIQQSKTTIEIRNEIDRRLDEMEIQIGCDACGSDVESRVGTMKWNSDKDPTTPAEWELMEKVNDFMEIPVRWVRICTNPDCMKMWKEGKFEEEVVEPKIKSITNKIRAEVLRDWGLS